VTGTVISDPHRSAAAELHVSVNTISFHLRHIYDRLQVHSKSEAVAEALRQRLIRRPPSFDYYESRW
jgi:FixJ family two-component response regulator